MADFPLKVSFALRSDDLVIRAKHINVDSPILQLIPSQKFVDDLPMTLITGHTHWLNLDTSEIEIRPAENAWISSPDNWRLRFAVTGSSTLQKAGVATLVDVRSRTWWMIAQRMHPLEDDRYIMVTCDVASSHASSVKVELPRYGLEFFIDEDGELQSRNMRNMVVDSIQSTGAMFGLINQLVLRPKSQIADEHAWTVIIPDGRISYTPDGHHVRVTITAEGTRIAYHLYRVDPDLRCLTGNVGLTSKLYQALLHAITSGCLPDPLTGRTGTEEALHILHSAACLSFMKLRFRDTDLLREISSLSTRRAWYPVHLRKMQTVPWSSLSSLAQHHGFHTAAKSIMDYGMQLSAFSEKSLNVTFDLPPHTDHLLQRSSIRASVLYPDQFSLPLLRGDTDVIYASRDMPDKCAEERAFGTAFMVYQWPSRLPVQQNLLSVLTQWKQFQGVGESLSLRYSRDWLRPSFPDVLFSAYDLCRSVSENHAYQLVFTLASIAYGSEDKHALLPTLLAFATVPEIRHMVGPPRFTSYDLSDGFIPSNALLGNLIASCAINFDRSQERNLAAMIGEDKKALKRRRHSAFEDKCASQKQVILSTVGAAWPCEDPPQLSTLQASCYDINKLSRKLGPVFRSCWRNRSLKQHLDVLQGILNRFYTPNPPSKLPSHYALNSHVNYIASPTSSVDAQNLFNRNPPATQTFRSSHILPGTNQRDLVSPDSGLAVRLQKLVDDFRDRGCNKFHHKYADDLDRSRSIFCEEELAAPLDTIPYTMEVLLEHHSQCSAQFYTLLAAVKDALSPASDAENALHNAGLWPRVTPNFIFSRMASVFGSRLGTAWRMALVCLSRILLQLQRSRRLLVFAANNNRVEFFKELENKECEGFDPESYPDWLLIQVRCNNMSLCSGY
jgi:hypothetical protein